MKTASKEITNDSGVEPAGVHLKRDLINAINQLASVSTTSVILSVIREIAALLLPSLLARQTAMINHKREHEFFFSFPLGISFFIARKEIYFLERCLETDTEYFTRNARSMVKIRIVNRLKITFIFGNTTPHANLLSQSSFVYATEYIFTH